MTWRVAVPQRVATPPHCPRNTLTHLPLTLLLFPRASPHTRATWWQTVQAYTWAVRVLFVDRAIMASPARTSQTPHTEGAALPQEKPAFCAEELEGKQLDFHEEQPAPKTPPKTILPDNYDASTHRSPDSPGWFRVSLRVARAHPDVPGATSTPSVPPGPFCLATPTSEKK